MNQAVAERISDATQKIGPGLRRIIGNMGWLLLDRVVRMGMALVVGVWVARYLGPARFGQLNFAIAFVALFGTVTTLGLEQIVIRDLVHRPEEANEILGTTLVLRLTAGVAAAALSVLAVHLLQPSDTESLLLVAILSSTLLFQAFDTIDSLFQSQVRSKLTVWAKNSAFLIFAAIKILLIRHKAPLSWFAIATAGEIAAGAMGLILVHRIVRGRLRAWTISRSRAAMLLRQSWPLIFSGLAIMVYMRLDTIMLKMMSGDTAVGVYSAAVRVSEVWYFIPSAIVSSVSPAIMLAKDDPLLFHNRLRRLFALMTIVSYSIGTLVAVFSPLIIRMLYSASYSAAAPILSVHIWASIFVFLGVAQTPWDVTHNLMKLSLYRTSLGAVLNVAINLVLIPRLGAMGAAIATVISYAIASVFANALSARTRPVFWMQMRALLPNPL